MHTYEKKKEKEVYLITHEYFTSYQPPGNGQPKGTFHFFCASVVTSVMCFGERERYVDQIGR